MIHIYSISYPLKKLLLVKKKMILFYLSITHYTMGNVYNSLAFLAAFLSIFSITYINNSLTNKEEKQLKYCKDTVFVNMNHIYEKKSNLTYEEIIVLLRQNEECEQLIDKYQNTSKTSNYISRCIVICNIIINLLPYIENNLPYVIKHITSIINILVIFVVNKLCIYFNIIRKNVIIIIKKLVILVIFVVNKSSCLFINIIINIINIIKTQIKRFVNAIAIIIAEQAEQAEPVQSVQQIQQIQPIQPVQQVEPVQQVQQVQQVEPVEPVQRVEPVPQVKRVKQIEQVKQVKQIKQEEPVLRKSPRINKKN